MTTILDQISQIKQGLAINEISPLIKSLDITEKRLAEVIGLSVSTLAIRKKTGTFNAFESERIMRIKRIFARAMEVFDNDADVVKRWLKTPARAFDNIPPIGLIETDIGAREVENLLGRIEYGVYS